MSHSKMDSPFFAKGIQTPLKAIWKNKAGDFSTSFWWPQQHDKCHNENITTKKYNVLFMIVGNPGVPEYYIPFLSYIYKLHNKNIEIVLIGHLGQTLDIVEPPKVHGLFTLQEQVEHKVEFFDQLIENYPQGTDFFVMGHSLGAWLCEQVVKYRPNANIKQVFSLFPTLCKLKDTPNGKWMSKYVFPVEYRKFLTTLVSGLSLLPPQLLTYFLSIFSHLPGNFAHITNEKLIKYPFFQINS